VHDEAYIAAVRQAGQDGRGNGWFGLGTPDNPVFPGMHEASALIAGGTLAAARAVWEGSSLHAANVAGGLHHAMRRSASGFCIYNDPAIAIASLLALGASRIAYVDLDVHHGDGVQAAFYSDPRVLTISLHEHPATLFPGTGLASEIGNGDGQGYAVNVALPAGTGDAGWLRAIDAVVPPLVSAFAPDVLVTQHGCDTHLLDPLAHLSVSLDGQRHAAEMMHTLAHSAAGGRWVLCGGGGYQRVQVVPRCWTHLLAIAAEAPVPASTLIPESWRALAQELTGEDPPGVMTDEASAGFVPIADSGIDPQDPVDRAILNTQQAVFGWHGLFPGSLFSVYSRSASHCRRVVNVRSQRFSDCSQIVTTMRLSSALLFSARDLRLDTYVTGAKDPVKCVAPCGEATYGRRNPPKRREVPYCR
jgi:acetoin utilization protein AcuC